MNKYLFVFNKLLCCVITRAYSSYKEKEDTYTKMSSVYTEKYQERNEICLRALRCSSPSRRLLQMIYTETLLKVCSKFQIFLSYSFLIIDFLIRRHTCCLTFNKSLAI